jgi:hypothetical protein
MKHKIIIMGFLSGLLGIFGCGNQKNDTTSGKDSAQNINFNDILFTTPTLENALPDFENKMDTSNLQFHEDDWRQIEFISKNQKDVIDKEIAKIKDIYVNHSHKGDTYTAFKEVAVRDLITQPLAIEFLKVKSYLADKDIPIYGVSLQNNSGQVRNGFSFSANGIDYYGQLDENKKIKWFCIYSAESQESLKSSIGRLSKLLATENLYLVDWRQMKVFDEVNIKTDFVTNNN